MGKVSVGMEISAALSNHNSHQDETDRKAWEELCDRIRNIVNEQRYIGIIASTFGGADDEL